MYRLFYNNLGQLDAIASPSGASLLFNPQTKTFDEAHPLTVELRAWEQENGALDLSDREPEPQFEVIAYRLNQLLSSDREPDCDRFPADINYNTGLLIGLTTKTIDYFGLRVAQVFYQSIDPETLDLIEPVPIVFERYKYSWDLNTGLPVGRVKEIYFYKEDSTLSEQFKLLPKEFYNVSDRAAITTYRRQTILAWLIARATELGLGQQVKAYFADYKDQTDKYVLYGDRTIIETVETATEPWFDLDTTTAMGTVRQAIVLCFSKALEPTGNNEVDEFLRTSNNATTPA